MLGTKNEKWLFPISAFLWKEGNCIEYICGFLVKP